MGDFNLSLSSRLTGSVAADPSDRKQLARLSRLSRKQASFDCGCPSCSRPTGFAPKMTGRFSLEEKPCIHIGFVNLSWRGTRERFALTRSPRRDQEYPLKSRLSVFLIAVSLFHLSLAAQTAAPASVSTDKDADKKNPVVAKTRKKDEKKDEKKEEPKKEEKKGGMTADTFAGLKFRLIGPAVASGRVMSIAVNPKNKNEYYVGVASG